LPSPRKNDVAAKFVGFANTTTTKYIQNARPWISLEPTDEAASPIREIDAVAPWSAKFAFTGDGEPLAELPQLVQ
jgi:hypothetical protein